MCEKVKREWSPKKPEQVLGLTLHHFLQWNMKCLAPWIVPLLGEVVETLGSRPGWRKWNLWDMSEPLNCSQPDDHHMLSVQDVLFFGKIGYQNPVIGIWLSVRLILLTWPFLTHCSQVLIEPAVNTSTTVLPSCNLIIQIKWRFYICQAPYG